MSKNKILVVDNEDPICDLYQRLLMHEGYYVEAFGEGEKAIARVGQEHFDLVLTDLKMPKIDGYNVIRRVREVSPKTGIIVITGYATVDSVVETIKMGAYDYILKPFEIGDLLTKIRQCLNREDFC